MNNEAIPTFSFGGDPGDEPTVTQGAGERPGRWIGPYRLLEVIGEGGFGVVWLAERRRPYVQKVALKVIKAGMDTRAVIARFEQERQALAVMDHPNVAKVHDAGVTDGGKPFFVMEHVSGEPITDFCNRNQLTLRQRLELFILVCEAVQHAHQKGIIHRDLKPSNILVGFQGEGPPAPKVIDFGVAKAIRSPLTDKTIHTEIGQLIGTPEYMSPEQAEMTGTDIDTRTDVYALGAILYELLTGTMPFDSKVLRARGYDSIQRVLREQEPPRPSTRLSSLGGESGLVIARQRQLDRTHLVAELKRELDWIILKCLEKDRSRRYETANGLAMDVRRYLTGEPVLAAPQSAAYRLGKLVRRHRGWVAAIGAVTTALLLGIVGTSIGLSFAVASRNRAREQAARSDQVKGVLTDILAAAGPGVARGRDAALLRDLMDQATRDAHERLKEYPAVEAEIRTILGSTLRDIGDYEAGARELMRAMEIYRALGPREEGALADATQALGHLYILRAAAAKALPLFEDAYPILVRSHGAESLPVAINLDYRGTALRLLGKPGESDRLALQALDMKRRLLPPNDERIAESLTNIANALIERQEFGKATSYAEGAVTIFRTKGEGHGVDLATALSNLGNAQRGTGKLVEAKAAMEEALALHRKLEGDKSMDAAIDLAKLASVVEELREFDAAERCYLEAKEIFTDREGEGHVYVSIVMNNLGLMYFKKGDYVASERWLRLSADRHRKADGADHPMTAQTELNLARAIAKQGRTEEALPIMRRALEVFRASEGDSGIRAQKARVSLAEALTSAGKSAPPARADLLLGEAVKVASTAFELSGRQSADDAWRKVRDQAAQEITRAYDAWHLLRPKAGYDAKAAQWRSARS